MKNLHKEAGVGPYLNNNNKDIQVGLLGLFQDKLINLNTCMLLADFVHRF